MYIIADRTEILGMSECKMRVNVMGKDLIIDLVQELADKENLCTTEESSKGVFHIPIYATFSPMTDPHGYAKYSFFPWLMETRDFNWTEAGTTVENK